MTLQLITFQFQNRDSQNECPSQISVFVPITTYRGPSRPIY